MKTRFNRLCIPVTVYSLFLYVMSCSDEEFEDTFFLFGKGIPKSITSTFKNSYKLLYNQYEKKGLLKYRFFYIVFYWRYVKWFVLPRVKNLYCNDHLSYCSYMIGKRSYTLIEDAPHSNTFMDNSVFAAADKSRQQMKFFKLATLIYGPIYGHSLGMNSQCTDLLMWKYDETDFIKSKKCHIVDMSKIWEDCSDDKRSLLMEISGIDNNEEFSKLKEYPIILLTQPIYQNDIIAHTVIYKSIAEKYPKDQLVIKTHPRDEYDYEKILPGYFVFRKPIPIQLLDIMGIKWKKAVTVSSTSVLDFDYQIDIDWYGNGCGSLFRIDNPNFPIPTNANLCSID